MGALRQRPPPPPPSPIAVAAAPAMVLYSGGHRGDDNDTPPSGKSWLSLSSATAVATTSTETTRGGGREGRGSLPPLPGSRCRLKSCRRSHRGVGSRVEGESERALRTYKSGRTRRSPTRFSPHWHIRKGKGKGASHSSYSTYEGGGRREAGGGYGRLLHTRVRARVAVRLLLSL